RLSSMFVSRCRWRSLSPSPLPVSLTDTAPTEIYTLSLHDALPISHLWLVPANAGGEWQLRFPQRGGEARAKLAVEQTFQTLRGRDRKSTRLNSSHVKISYAVFCLKKKKKKNKHKQTRNQA